MKLGFVGVGAIAEAVITGLCASPAPPARIVISPRNAARAAQLAARYDRVEVAADNQGVVDACDVVCISVRPDIARDVLSELRFREKQCVVSLLPTFSLADIRALTAPAGDACRLLPLPCAARREGPIAIYPAGHSLRAMFSQLGAIVDVAREEEFGALLATTAFMASFFAAQDQIAHWLTDRNVSALAARRYVAHMMAALSHAALDETQPYEDLVLDHMTLGGLNAQMLRELRATGVYDTLGLGLDLIFERIQGRAGFAQSLKDLQT